VLVYACMYRDQKLLIAAATSYDAQQQAARRLRLKQKQSRNITVYLTEQPLFT